MCRVIDEEYLNSMGFKERRIWMGRGNTILMALNYYGSGLIILCELVTLLW